MNQWWVIAVGVSFLAGYFIVQYMVQSLARLGLYAVLMVAAFIGLVFLLVTAYREQWLISAGLLFLAGLLVGYLAANALFLRQEEIRELPTLTRTDGGDGHTAVLYFTHGEPPGYSPLPWIETIREYDHDNVPFIPWVFRPLFFNQLRAEYFKAGGSAHNKLHQAFFDTLRHSMPEEMERGTKFYLAFLDSNPRPDEMTIHAINDGASKIIVLPVFITESTHTLAGQEMVNSVEPECYGVQVCYTGALWNSESLQASFVERAVEMTGSSDKTDIGVLLVGHGQPTQWENLYPAQNRQETEYREAILEKLVEAGYKSENIFLGWMEYQQPTITKAVSELAERGVKKILVFAVSLSADSIHSDIEVPAAVAEADLPETIQIAYIGQYGDHPLAIQAMREKIVNCK